VTSSDRLVSERPDAAETIAQAIEQRRSINFFAPQTPPREIIERSIDLARWAPNHHLTEPWHFYLLSDETKAAIVELNAQIVEARKGPEAAQKKRERWSTMPGWLIVTSDINEDELTRREDYAAVCCAIHSMSLYLWTYGIGTKWTTGPVTRDPGFYDAAWIDPDREDVVGLIWYGYPIEVPVSTRKPLDQILSDV